MSQKIEDYALIGDCETAALVGRDGSIDWLCWPALRFRRLLCRDARHAQERPLADRADRGRPRSLAPLSRQHLILETRFETESGTVALIDFMPPRGKASDIVRLVRGVAARSQMQMELVHPLRLRRRHSLGDAAASTASLLAIAGPDMTVLRTPVETRGEDLTTVADFKVTAGETVPFVLTYGALASRSARRRSIRRSRSRRPRNSGHEWSSRCTATANGTISSCAR